MKDKKKIIQKLRNRYRLILYNDSTFQTVWTTQLTRLKVGLIGTAIALAFIILTILTIVFTSLKEYIPGYPGQNVRASIINNALLVDSLDQEIKLRDNYLTTIQTLIHGDVPADPVSAADSLTPEQKKVKFHHYNHDSIFSQDLLNEQISLSLDKGRQQSYSLAEIHFFTPLKGMISEHFDKKSDHFGVDIVGLPNARISAVLDGTIIFAGWTAKAGNVIYIQHGHDLVSVYKHNSELLKKTGDRVKAGEVIAFMGNTGELSTGPHLHFELWHKGIALDPEQYIDF